MTNSQTAIPTSVSVALDTLKNELARAAGGNLAGLILYGGVARGRYRVGKSDVNVVVLLQDASDAALAAIAPALRAARRSIGVEPFILTPREVPHVAAAFPIKLLDIKRHHVVLAGSDPFTGLEIDREQVRLRTSQELRNLLMRLRHRRVAADGDALQLSVTLADSARSLAIGMNAALFLVGKEPPEDDRTAAIFSAAAAAFGLDAAPLATLADLRQGTSAAVEPLKLFAAVLTALERVLELVDAK